MAVRHANPLLRQGRERGTPHTEELLVMVDDFNLASVYIKRAALAMLQAAASHIKTEPRRSG